MITISEIIDWYKSRNNNIVKGEVDISQKIIAPRTINEAKQDHISFIGEKLEPEFDKIIDSTNCKVIIIDDCFQKNLEKRNSLKDIVFIISKSPKADVIEFCKKFLGFMKPAEKSDIHSKAYISGNTTVGKNVKIDAFAVIEDNVTIGDNCIIGANSVIKMNTVIRNGVEIGSNTVIGGVGFGFVQQEGGDRYEQFPHYGGVIISNNVHIGNNTCIDRGSLSDTIIGEGVKIDNLVHIAHNVKIGKNSLVIACSMIAGSVVIGDGCWVAPCSSIRNAITIGNNVTVGLSSTVTKSIPDDQVVMGSPAMSMDDFIVLRNHQKELISRQKNRTKPNK